MLDIISRQLTKEDEKCHLTNVSTWPKVPIGEEGTI